MLNLKCLRFFLLLFICTPFALAQTPANVPAAAKTPATMTNADVIALVSADLGDEIVIAKIDAAPSTAFDVSIPGLKALKAAGVSIAVVKTMISPPQQRAASIAAVLPDPEDFNQVQPTGVYALVHQGDEAGHLTKLAYTASSRLRRVWTHIIATLDGPSAAEDFTDLNPVFYIYPKTDDVTTQKEMNTIQLLKFKVKKTEREVVLGSEMKAGIEAGSLIEVKIVQVKYGIYKVTPTKPLEPGEYALYEGGTWLPEVGPAGGGTFFEFGVGGKKP